MSNGKFFTNNSQNDIGSSNNNDNYSIQKLHSTDITRNENIQAEDYY